MTNKGPSSQTYGFSSGHVWMWGLDYKESWVLKNRSFWTVVLEKTLESPLDCKEIQPVHPKGNSWIFTGRTDLKLKLQYLGHLVRRTNSFEKILMLWKIESRRKRDDRGWDGWMVSPMRLTWISHGCTCVPHSVPPSHLPPHPIPLGHPSAPALSTPSHALNLDWRSLSHMIMYMFQCYSLRVLWTSSRFNQSILREVGPGCSLEGLIFKLKLQYFGHLMQRADLFEKTLMLGKIEGRRRGQQRLWWLDGITDSMDMSLGKIRGAGDGPGGLAYCGSWGCKDLDTTEPAELNWTELILGFINSCVTSEE